LVGSGAQGVLNCVNGQWFEILFNRDWILSLSSPDRKAVIAHEIGHAHRIDHAGREMTVWQGPQLMHTCDGNGSSQGRQLRDDDEGSLTYQYKGGGTWGGFDGVSANVGFEQNGLYWYFPGSVSYKSSGGNIGPRYVQWQPPGVNDKASQWLRIATNGKGGSMRPMANFKKLDASHEKGVAIRIRYQIMDLDNAGPCSGNYYQQIDETEPFTYIGNPVYGTQGTYEPTTSWSGLTASASPFYSAFDAYEVLVYATSAVEYPLGSGNLQAVGVDNLRLGLNLYP